MRILESAGVGESALAGGGGRGDSARDGRGAGVRRGGAGWRVFREEKGVTDGWN